MTSNNGLRFLDTNHRIFRDGAVDDKIKIRHNSVDALSVSSTETAITGNIQVDNVTPVLYGGANGVSIGTTNEVADLTGAIRLHVHKNATNGCNIQITNETSTNAAERGLRLGLTSVTNAQIWNYENTLMLFGTNNTERMRITGGGDLSVNTDDFYVDVTNSRVGINTAVPGYALDVSGSGNVSGTYKIAGTDVLSSTTLGSGVINSSLTSVGTLTGLTMGGTLNMSTNNITNATSITATNLTGTLQTAAQTNITSVGTLTSLTMGGTLNMSTNNITNATSITATNLTGTLQTAAQTNITSVGTLTSLTMGGTLNMSTNNITNATSITATNLTGTLQTAAQTNITSVGTLTGLTMGGTLNMSTNNITNATSITATNLTGTLQTAAQTNITSVGTLTGLTMGGTLNMGTNNITNATSITATNLTGTLQTAAQTNITSVGTLTSLTMGGTLNMGTNNITNATSITATNLTGTLQTAAQTNITSVGTLTGVDVNGSAILRGITDTTVDPGIFPDTVFQRCIQLNNTAGDSRAYYVGLLGDGITPTNNKFAIGFDGGGAPDPNISLTIDNNGYCIFNTRIGLGITNPNYMLHNHETAAATANFMQITNGSTGTTTNDGFVYGLDNAQRVRFINRENTDMLFFTNNAERIRLMADGSLGIGTNAATKIVEIVSTTSGLVIPRMTTAQRDVITAVAGEMIYNTTTNKHQGYNGSTWNDFY